jgi:surface-anchored protein
MTTRTIRRTVASGALSAAVVAAGVLITPSAATAADRVVLSKGHVDAMDVRYADGALSLKVNDDTVSPSVIRNPADLTFHVPPPARTTVPDLPSYSFLGPAGSEVWMLPQVQDQNLLWPGWNTTTLTAGTFTGDRVRLSLVGVDGPGKVSLFGSTPFGDAVVYFRSDDGLPDALDVPIRTHAHASWAFSAPGSYTLRWQADATLTNGARVSTGPVPYTFVVGDLDPAGPQVTVAVEGAGDGVEYQPGDEVTLRAVQTPQTEHDHYHWFTRCAGATEWAIVPGEAGATYAFTATRELNACEYQVRLYDHDHAVLAASEPATLWVAPDEPEPPAASQRITASINASDGALTVSVDPDDRSVVLPAAQLAGGGDRWESSGELRPVTITDTRAGTPGWNVSGQIPAPFRTTSGAEFSSNLLGWTPEVTTQANGQGAVPGPRVEPRVAGGDGPGLATSAVLASAPGGAGRGTARLGAGLRLSVPTETAAGTYTSLLTLTAI